MPLRAAATEEPEHEVLRRIGDVELRRYAPYVVAEVILQTSSEDAGSQAFPLLAGYIFGKNRGAKKFEMTAPVTQTAAPQRLEMTAPVTQAAVPDGVAVQFVLPRGVTLDTAPEPLDPRVRLRQEPERRWAVIRYSGRWTADNERHQLALLRAALAAADVGTEGEPVLARYNAPFVPGFMRRNEIWLALR